MIKKETINATNPEMVAVVGIPFDEHTSLKKGAALAPESVRKILKSSESSFCCENGIDLSEESRFKDLGDLELKGKKKAFEQIESTVSQLLDRGVYVLSLGGDHSITYPLIRAYRKNYSPLNILHFDAHPDLGDEHKNGQLSHLSTFARIMEEGFRGKLVQVGIRKINTYQRMQVEKFNVEVIEMKDFYQDIKIDFYGPVYLSLDIGVLDPAFAGATNYQEPGGFSVRELLSFIQHLNVPIVGADIVEYNPKLDTNESTARVAAKFLKEIAGTMLQQNQLNL